MLILILKIAGVWFGLSVLFCLAFGRFCSINRPPKP